MANDGKQEASDNTKQETPAVLENAPTTTPPKPSGDSRSWGGRLWLWLNKHFPTLCGIAIVSYLFHVGVDEIGDESNPWAWLIPISLAAFIGGALTLYLKVKSGYKWMNDKVDDYLRARFQQLCREYATLPPTQEELTSRPMQTLLAKSNDSQQVIELKDLYEIELAFLKAQPYEVLCSRGWKYRSDYQDIVGERIYMRYVAQRSEALKSVENAQTEDERKRAMPLLLADLEFVVSELYRLYNLQIARERVRSLMLLIISGGAGLVLSLLFVGLGFSVFFAHDLVLHPHLGVPYMLLVAMSGALGGFVSTQIRLQDTTLDDRPISNLIGLVYGRASVYLAPINGFLFATVFYFVLAGGLISGKVFPNITVPKGMPAISRDQGAAALPPPGAASAGTKQGSAEKAPPTTQDKGEKTPQTTNAAAETPPQEGIVTVETFLLETGPSDGLSFAGMLVWSFIAGFAERLVPDALDRLVAKSKDVDGTLKKS